MKKILTIVGGVVVAAVGVGCADVSRPSWLHPGPAPYQQKRAERFDPYPENDLGPPVVGVRPRDYDKPVPEVERARWQPWNSGR